MEIANPSTTTRASTSSFDSTKGETQRYSMAVAGPAFVDSELEQHHSLLQHAAMPDEQSNVGGGVTRPSHFNARRTSATTVVDPDHAALRRQYSGTEALARPRPTTPTSTSAIDAYVQQQGETPTADTTKRMRVAIPQSSVSIAPKSVLPSTDEQLNSVLCSQT